MFYFKISLKINNNFYHNSGKTGTTEQWAHFLSKLDGGQWGAEKCCHLTETR